MFAHSSVQQHLHFKEMSLPPLILLYLKLARAISVLTCETTTCLVALAKCIQFQKYNSKS